MESIRDLWKLSPSFFDQQTGGRLPGGGVEREVAQPILSIHLK